MLKSSCIELNIKVVFFFFQWFSLNKTNRAISELYSLYALIASINYSYCSSRTLKRFKKYIYIYGGRICHSKTRRNNGKLSCAYKKKKNEKLSGTRIPLYAYNEISNTIIVNTNEHRASLKV